MEEQRKREAEEIEKALDEDDNRVDILNSVKEHQAEMDEITCLFRDNMDADVVENHTNKTIVKSRKKGAKEVEIAPGENKVINIGFENFRFHMIKQFYLFYRSLSIGQETSILT